MTDNRTSKAVDELQRLAKEAVMTEEFVQTIDLDEKGVPTLLAIAEKYKRMEEAISAILESQKHEKGWPRVAAMQLAMQKCREAHAFDAVA